MTAYFTATPGPSSPMRGVGFQVVCANGTGCDELVMLFINNLDHAINHGQFEHGDALISHELR